MLRALGVTDVHTYHMNEGHAAFLTLELIREKMTSGKNFQDAVNQTRAECIFTTHTPVEAGHDRFSPALMDYAMHRFRGQVPAPFEELVKLSICMTKFYTGILFRVRDLPSGSSATLRRRKSGSSRKQMQFSFIT